MDERKRHVDGLAFVNGKQRQVVNGHNHAHIAGLVAFGSKTQLFFVALNEQVRAKLLELADQTGEIAGRKCELGLVIDVGDFHKVGLQLDQRKLKMLVERL